MKIDGNNIKGIYNWEPNLLFTVGDLVIHKDLIWKCIRETSEEPIKGSPSYVPWITEGMNQDTFITSHDQFNQSPNPDHRVVTVAGLEDIISKKYGMLLSTTQFTTLEPNYLTSNGVYIYRKKDIDNDWGLLMRDDASDLIIIRVSRDNGVVIQELFADTYLGVRKGSGTTYVNFEDWTFSPVQNNYVQSFSNMIELSMDKLREIKDALSIHESDVSIRKVPFTKASNGNVTHSAPPDSTLMINIEKDGVQRCIQLLNKPGTKSIVQEVSISSSGILTVGGGYSINSITTLKDV